MEQKVGRLETRVGIIQMKWAGDRSELYTLHNLTYWRIDLPSISHGYTRAKTQWSSARRLPTYREYKQDRVKMQFLLMEDLSSYSSLHLLATSGSQAPAQANRFLRLKVWSCSLLVLDSILKLHCLMISIPIRIFDIIIPRHIAHGQTVPWSDYARGYCAQQKCCRMNCVYHNEQSHS